MKNTGKSFVLHLAAAVLALAGMVIYFVTNSTPGYALISGTTGIIAGVAGVILSAVCALAVRKFGAQHFTAFILGLAALAGLMVAIGVLLSGRAELASALFTWNSGNTLGWRVFYTSVASGACLLVSVIVLIVAGFAKDKAAE